MQFHSIDSTLRHGLKPLYLIISEIPTLAKAARQKIYRAAHKMGFSQCDIIIADKECCWTTVEENLTTDYLWSQKIIVDFRIMQWTEATTKTLLNYLKNPNPHKLLIVSTNKLSQTQQKAQWFKTIDKIGDSILIRPTSNKALAQWIQQRLHTTQLKIDAQSIQCLIENTKNDLVTIEQTIEKLQLLYPKQTITSHELHEVFDHDASFNVFELSHAILCGQKAQIILIFSSLKTQNEPSLILWSLARDIRCLIQLLEQKEKKRPLNALLDKEWAFRRQALTLALKRQNKKYLLHCLQKVSHIDKMIKGLSTENYWNALESLALSIAE